MDIGDRVKTIKGAEGVICDVEYYYRGDQGAVYVVVVDGLRYRYLKWQLTPIPRPDPHSYAVRLAVTSVLGNGWWDWEPREADQDTELVICPQYMECLHNYNFCPIGHDKPHKPGKVCGQGRCFWSFGDARCQPVREAA